MPDPIPPSEIAVGSSVTVALDAGADRGAVVGTGRVTYTAERTEVVFDNGSGGMFPNRMIFPPTH